MDKTPTVLELAGVPAPAGCSWKLPLDELEALRSAEDASSGEE